MKLNSTHKEVIKWIEDFKEQDYENFPKDIEDELYENLIYMKGNCSFFAFELLNAFPQGEIWTNEDFSHAVVEIEGLLFDIRGILFVETVFGIIFDTFSPATRIEIEIMKAWSHKDGSSSSELYPEVAINLLNKKAFDFYDCFETLSYDEDSWALSNIIAEIRHLFGNTLDYIAEKDYEDKLFNNRWSEVLNDFDY